MQTLDDSVWDLATLRIMRATIPNYKPSTDLWDALWWDWWLSVTTDEPE